MSRGPAAAASHSSTEMHSFHLHGHHFWLLATGQGVWNASEDPASYNLDNPPLRDTAILLPNGWTALRFVVCLPAQASLQCMGLGFKDLERLKGGALPIEQPFSVAVFEPG